MKDLLDIVDLIVFIVTGFIGGIGAEVLAKRYLLRPSLILAFLIGLAGGVLGSLFFNDVLGILNDPAIEHVSIFPVLFGVIILLIPWWLVRAGRTPYGNKRKWQRKYRR